MTAKLRKQNWEVRPAELQVAQNLVEKYHYAHGGSNTAVYVHGLFPKGTFGEENCKGVAWWIPPTKTAAQATYPDNWRGVLMLSRFVIVPEMPNNAASFLLGRSMKLINRERWPCLVTYADESQNHKGIIYHATNWKYVGKTKPEPMYVLNDRMLSRKAGPKTRTHIEMLNLGAQLIGRFAKHKFIHVAEVS